MLTFSKKTKQRVGGMLLAIQMLLLFLVPVNAAYAAPMPYSEGVNHWCISQAFGGYSCFPDETSCADAAPLAALSCKDIDTTKTSAQKKAIADEGVGFLNQDAGQFLLDKGLELVGKVLELVAQFINTIAGLFMRSMGSILDIAIERTINSHTYRDLTAVAIGWTAVRDFSNMFFIFVLLYISIQTILGLAGGSAKRWLSHVIIAALLINFSLFFTQVVIDAGNVLAMGFWNNITTNQGGTMVNTATAPFLKAFQVQTIFDTPDGQNTSSMNRAMVYAGGALIMFVAGYVFLAGAVMMIIRTVTLLILMIVSPFAFLGFALPKGGGFAQLWLDKLISNAFVAPAFVAMLYLDSIIINSLDLKALAGGDQSKWVNAFIGKEGSYDIVYQFALCIILLLASLTVANKVSNGAGSAGGAWAKKMIGGGVAIGFAGAAMAGRQTLGRAAAADLKNEAWVKKQNQLVAKGGMRDATYLDKMKAKAANAQLAGLEKMKKGTFDLRNAPAGGLGVTAALGKVGITTGAGSKKSYETSGAVLSSVTGGYRGTEKEKELIAIAKERYPDDPAAQKAYIEARGVELDAKRNKDVKTEIDRKIKIADVKEKLKTEPARYEELKQKFDQLKTLKDAGTANAEQLTALTEAEKSMTGSAKSIAAGLQQLTGKEVAELSKETLSKKVIQENLNAQHLGAILNYDKEKGYNDPAFLPAIGAAVLASQNTGAKNYMRKISATSPGAFGLDFKKDVVDLKEEYETHKGANTLDEIDPVSGKTHKERLNDQIAKSLGYMEPKDITDWDEELITHDAIARNLNKQHLAKLVEKQKTDSSYDDAFFTKLSTAINDGGNQAAKNYIDGAKGDNPFKGKGAPQPQNSATPPPQQPKNSTPPPPPGSANDPYSIV